MICKSCGTDIADKALICYRCGAATTEARRQPAALNQGGRGGLFAGIALATLFLAALFMAQAATGDVPAWVSYTIAGMALIVLVWRQWRRLARVRRRR
jgi:Flp pilus assembly protein TadB